MLKICSVSGKNFEIFPEDQEFYKKVAFPPPQLCPDERLRRRLAHRNELALHPRNCSLCKKRIISMYHEDTPFPVYCAECWWSDAWDPRDFTTEFDFERPFFEQFYELQSQAPRLYMFAQNNDNCDFTNGTQQNKDCYLIFASDHNQDCLYSHSIFHSTSCLDTMSCRYSECCYECIGCDHCNELYYSQNCINCYSSYFLHNCKGCSNCLFCSNLRNKKFHIANEPVSRDDYYSALKNLALDTHSGMELAKQMQQNLLNGSFEPHIYGERNQEVTGDYVFNSKKSCSCFDSHELEDCKYIIHGNRSKNCYDGYAVVDDSELCHENISAIGLFSCSFTTSVWRGHDIYYSALCTRSNNLFGCIGLRDASYCIFNKQYTRNNYYHMLKLISEQMKKTAEWGEFFPIEYSPFSYNDSLAQEYFPLAEEQVLAKGWSWYEEKESRHNEYSPCEIPDAIADVGKDIISKTLICEKTGRPFRIAKEELRLYKKFGVPIPRTCFTARHNARFALRNPRRLNRRYCDCCRIEMDTSFPKHVMRKVYCRDCYLAQVS